MMPKMKKVLENFAHKRLSRLTRRITQGREHQKNKFRHLC